jgi:hypothetical protein
MVVGTGTMGDDVLFGITSFQTADIDATTRPYYWT